MGDYTFKLSDYGSHTLVFNNFGDEVSPHSLVAEIDSLQSQLDEIRSVSGYPAKYELEKRGLTDSLVDIVRCNHQRYMESMHRAEQREIKAQGQVESLQSQLSEAMAQRDKFQNLFLLAMDFIGKHPADPDISKDQTEAWLKILNSNAMDEFARLRQQRLCSCSEDDEPSFMYDDYDEVAD